MITESEFLSFLDAKNVPWSATVESLKKTFGVTGSKFFDSDSVVLTTASAILSCQSTHLEVPYGKSPLLPPANFQMYIYPYDKAEENHAAALLELSKLLGDATPGPAKNTLSHSWAIGLSALKITTWPESLQGHTLNPVRDRFPELRRSCDLRLTTGYRPPITLAERESLDRFTAFNSSYEGVEPMVTLSNWTWEDTHRGLFRRTVADISSDGPKIGFDPETKTIIGIEKENVFFTPSSIIHSIHLERLRRSRFPGESSLRLRYRNLFSLREEWKDLLIFKGRDENDLDALAKELSMISGASLVSLDADNNG